MLVAEVSTVDNNKNRRWLQEDVINLVEMVDEDLSWGYIAHRLGRSEGACRGTYGKVRFAERINEDMRSRWGKVRIGPAIQTSQVKKLNIIGVDYGKEDVVGTGAVAAGA